MSNSSMPGGEPPKNPKITIPPVPAKPLGTSASASTPPAAPQSGLNNLHIGLPINLHVPLLPGSNLGINYLLERIHHERILRNETLESQDKERFEKDKRHNKDHVGVKDTGNTGMFKFRTGPKQPKRRMLVVEADHSEPKITEQTTQRHRVIGNNEKDAEKAFQQLLKVHDLTGLERYFDDQMQSEFRKFLLGWRVGLVRPHNKMHIKDTHIPWMVTSPASSKITKYQRCIRSCGRKCSQKQRESMTDDFTKAKSLEKFGDYSMSLTLAPSATEMFKRAKKIREQLFDQNYITSLCEGEAGMLEHLRLEKKYHKTSKLAQKSSFRMMSDKHVDNKLFKTKSVTFDYSIDDDQSDTSKSSTSFIRRERMKK